MHQYLQEWAPPAEGLYVRAPGEAGKEEARHQQEIPTEQQYEPES